MRSPTLSMLVFAMLLGSQQPAQSQTVETTPLNPNQLVLHGSPVMLGLAYDRTLSQTWEAGLLAMGGKQLGVTLSSEDTDNLDVWMNANLQLGLKVTPSFALVVRPIGVVVLSGDDFSAAYPSTSGGVEYRLRGFRFGSDVAVIRIAGVDGTGEYWVRWLPARIAFRL